MLIQVDSILKHTFPSPDGLKPSKTWQIKHLPDCKLIQISNKQLFLIVEINRILWNWILAMFKWKLN